MGNFCRKHCKAIRCLLPCVFKNDTGETVTVISNPHADGPFVSVPPNNTGGDGNKELMYVALYDYQARTPDELSFYAGDRMQILNSNQQNWLKAKLLSPRGNPEGYVPFNYVAPITSIESEPYFFCDFKRSDAEKQLILPGNGVGSFLIRESESQKGSYALSVYDGASVKHYKIQTSDNGRYFISTNRVFSSLPELVTFYRRSEGGLCCRLTNPCQRTGVPLPPDLCYQTSDHWEIDRTSLKFLKKLGHGQFGEVWEGLWTNTISVAIKTLKEGTMNPQDFLREAQFMKNLKHSKLIQLYAVCTLEEPVYIITELMRHGSLLSYLQNDRGATIGLPQQVDIAAQVSSGMEYLERQNFIHRDLAARNVLVGENGVYKVADFGLARVFEDDAVYLARKDTKLPLKWTAPEAIRDNKFSVKSDVWSFGILLYEISTYGQMPYQGMTGREAHEKVMRGYRLPKPPGCHASFYKIMLECWIEQPENRPTFATLQWRLEDFFEEESSSYYDPRPFLQSTLEVK